MVPVMTNRWDESESSSASNRLAFKVPRNRKTFLVIFQLQWSLNVLSSRDVQAYLLLLFQSQEWPNNLSISFTAYFLLTYVNRAKIKVHEKVPPKLDKMCELFFLIAAKGWCWYKIVSAWLSRRYFFVFPDASTVMQEQNGQRQGQFNAAKWDLVVCTVSCENLIKDSCERFRKNKEH